MSRQPDSAETPVDRSWSRNSLITGTELLNKNCTATPQSKMDIDAMVAESYLMLNHMIQFSSSSLL